MTRLRSGGPFTIVAPTDKAFEHLTEAERTALFRKENEAGVTNLVERHVLSGTLGWESVRSRLPKGAKCIGTVQCTNGTMYIVDSIIPEAKDESAK